MSGANRRAASSSASRTTAVVCRRHCWWQQQQQVSASTRFASTNCIQPTNQPTKQTHKYIQPMFGYIPEGAMSGNVYVNGMDGWMDGQFLMERKGRTCMCLHWLEIMKAQRQEANVVTTTCHNVVTSLLPTIS